LQAKFEWGSPQNLNFDLYTLGKHADNSMRYKVAFVAALALASYGVEANPPAFTCSGPSCGVPIRAGSKSKSSGVQVKMVAAGATSTQDYLSSLGTVQVLRAPKDSASNIVNLNIPDVVEPPSSVTEGFKAQAAGKEHAVTVMERVIELMDQKPSVNSAPVRSLTPPSASTKKWQPYGGYEPKKNSASHAHHATPAPVASAQPFNTCIEHATTKEPAAAATSSIELATTNNPAKKWQVSMCVALRTDMS